MNISDFVTVGLLVLLEGLLSADNALVLAVLVLGLPRPQQQKALRYGLLGAFVFRSLATILAVRLIAIAWIQLAGALYLFHLAYRHFRDAAASRSASAVRAAVPWLGLTAFWATVVRVELTDVVFAADSILVGVAISSKPWVIITGGMLGIAAMRMVTGHLVAVLRRYPNLINAAFVIVGWVGLKLPIEFGNRRGWLDFPIPTWVSASVVLIILAGAVLQAWARPPVRAQGAVVGQAKGVSDADTPSRPPVYHADMDDTTPQEAAAVEEPETSLAARR